MVKISRAQYEKDKDSIIQELHKNPILPVKEIAKKLGFSEQKIYKIKREYYHIKNNNEIKNNKLRYFIILIKINNNFLSLKYKINITSYLKNSIKIKNLNVDYCYKTHGASDYIIKIKSKDIIEAKIYVNELKKIFGKDLKQIRFIECIKCFINDNKNIKKNFNVLY